MIQVRNWRAVQNSRGGFDIHAPGCYDTFRGWAANEEVALQWLNDASGLTYDNLPAMSMDDLRIEHGPRHRLFDGWYSHVFYFYGEKRLGSVQTRHYRRRGCFPARTETLTCTGGYCARGSDIRWLLKENGFRLVSRQ